MSIRGPLVAECEGVSEQDVEAFLEEWARDLNQIHVEREGLPERMWWRHDFDCCDGIATYWATNVSHSPLPPPCPVCDPVGARKSSARALDSLARDLWRARPDVVLAEMDRKMEAGELGGDALEALVAVGEHVGRCEAEIERLRAELDDARDAF